MSATWRDLAAAISAAPAFPGARCRGRPHLFDPGEAQEPVDIVVQRQAQALELCARCPSLGRCRDWLDSLPRSKKPRGVVAGLVVGDRPSRGRVSDLEALPQATPGLPVVSLPALFHTTTKGI